jgi:hypothetical protein
VRDGAPTASDECDAVTMTTSSTAPRRVESIPRLDEHAMSIAADPDAVWTGLLETIERVFDGRAATGYARVVGCTAHTRSGPRPLDVGSTVAGFRVRSADPGRELVLEGGHRFSDYALIFRIESQVSGRSMLRAESRARFPGPAGALYRLLVIGTRFHTFSVQRLLSAVRDRAERFDR